MRSFLARNTRTRDRTSGDDPAPPLTDLLQELKRRSGLSYAELARKALTSRSSLHRYCTGTGTPPDPETIIRIARACGAGEDDLYALLRSWAAINTDPGPPATADDDAEATTTPKRRRLAVTASYLILALMAALTAASMDSHDLSTYPAGFRTSQSPSASPTSRPCDTGLLPC